MKYLKEKIAILSLFFAPLLVSAVDYKLAAPIPGGNSQGTVSGIAQYMGYVIPFLLSFAGVAALVMFIFGGIEYMSSAGNPSRMSSGKGRITSAISGLLLAIFSTLILTQINPQLLLVKIEGINSVGKIDFNANQSTGCNVCGGSCNVESCTAPEVCTSVSGTASGPYTCKLPEGACSEPCIGNESCFQGRCQDRSEWERPCEDADRLEGNCPTKKPDPSCKPGKACGQVSTQCRVFKTADMPTPEIECTP